MHRGAEPHCWAPLRGGPMITWQGMRPWQRDQIAFSSLPGCQFTRGVEHGIRHRADMGMNSPQVAEHVEMQ